MMHKMAFCDLCHMFQKEATNVPCVYVFAILLWGVLPYLCIVIQICGYLSGN